MDNGGWICHGFLFQRRSRHQNLCKELGHVSSSEHLLVHAVEGFHEKDVLEMLEGCFNPNEIVKIGNVRIEGALAVLKERVNLDMTLVIQNNGQFKMTKGLSEKERISKSQQSAENRIMFGEAKHGGPGAFKFNNNHDEVKTVTQEKKVGNRAAQSVSGQTFAEDVFSVAGETTIPDHQVEGEDESGSFASSITLN